MKTMIRTGGLLGALVLTVALADAALAQQIKTAAAPPSRSAVTTTTLAPAAGQSNAVLDRLKQVVDAYYDVPTLYPDNYTCEMRSPEMLNAVDPKLRQAWGQAYLTLARSAQGFQVTIENAAGTSNELAPVATQWQQTLATQMRQLESRLPNFVAACAISGLADYQAAMVRDGAATRIDFKAKSAADQITAASLWIDSGNALLRYVIVDKQGGRLEVALKNSRLRSPQPKLVATSVEIYTKRAGVEEKYWVDVDYQSVFGEKGKEHLLYRSIKAKRTDARGMLPHQLKAGEVNPVSFQFANYRVGPTSAPRAPAPPRFDDMYVTTR